MYSSINIIIPVYNEGPNIVNTLSELENKITSRYHIYLIYDFDDDNTIPPIRDYMKATGISLSLVKNKYGKGALNAIKTGFESVEDGVILVSMADLSDDYIKVDQMLKKINNGYDIVCGSRYIKGGDQIGGPWFKKFLSRIAGISLHYLINIPTHDITNSFKMYTKKIFNDITIESNGGFELGMEIVIKAYLNGYRIAEVPCIWKNRSAGKSRFRLLKWLPKYLYWYWFAIEGKMHRKAL